MTKLEIHNALTADKPKLKYWVDRRRSKISSEFKQENRFPSWKWDEYTHPKSHNRYLISFFAENGDKVDNPDVEYLAMMEYNGRELIIQWGYWPYTKFGETELVTTRYVGYYSSHFFQRYRERMWKDENLSTNELRCRFFSRNKQLTPIVQSEELSLKYKDYGELAQYAFMVKEGLCFIRSFYEGDESTVGQEGSSFVSTVLFCTFVNKKLLTKRQLDAIYKGEIQYTLDLYKLFSDLKRGLPIEKQDNLL